MCWKVRDEDQSDMMKLELAIIENLQREDLNAIDRARAFERLANEFHFKHGEIAKKVGKSREYVSNTIRLLMMPQSMQQALAEGKINEGHTRPLLMLIDRPQEQEVLFKEIMLKKLTVREAEGIARRIAFERVRKFDKMYDPDIVAMEQRLTESLGTRVAIETKEVGGKLVIDFFSDDDLRSILNMFNERTGTRAPAPQLDAVNNEMAGLQPAPEDPVAPVDDVPVAEINENEFDPKSFSL